MNLLVPTRQVLKDNGYEAFMGYEALASEVAPMSPGTKRLKEGYILHAFRAGEYLREKLKDLLECTAQEPADDRLRPLIEHGLVEYEGHVLQYRDCCVARGCVLRAEGCYLCGRAWPEGVARLEGDETQRLAKGVAD